MKTLLSLQALFLLLFSGCKKQETKTPNNFTGTDTSLPEFSRYLIRQGQQFCDGNTFIPVEYKELKFTVKFDSSAIYTTREAVNQNDINKLYGFSDNDTLHQLYSARFGWRWSNNAVRVFAYVYNNGERISKELSAIRIGTEYDCAIKAATGYYVFFVNNTSDTLPRMATTPKAKGYKLYPYFGGDEYAPHDITILIKEYSSE